MYSRLLYWEVENFMSIEKAVCEFDEKNIINLKGYNDSGKSAMLMALKVLMTNCNPQKQVGFIQDDKDYFRIVAHFDDGVAILRDKYANGQSLYEMYKGNDCIYSTKSKNGALTRVTEVPEPIANYLGLITYEGVCLNSRSCFEKQIGVQNTGSENYKMFNTVLKSEEIATAGELLNADKNKVLADSTALYTTMQGLREALGVGQYIKPELITILKEKDANADKYTAKEADLLVIQGLCNELKSVQVYPEVPTSDGSALSDLLSIQSLASDLTSCAVSPEVPAIDTEQLALLSQIGGIHIPEIAPEISYIDNLDDLLGITHLVEEYKGVCELLVENRENTENVQAELDALTAQLAEHKVQTVKCPSCGEVIVVEA